MHGVLLMVGIINSRIEQYEIDYRYSLKITLLEGYSAKRFVESAASATHPRSLPRLPRIARMVTGGTSSGIRRTQLRKYRGGQVPGGEGS